MLKNILNVNGAQEMSKTEQKAIKGSGAGSRSLCNSTCSGPIGSACGQPGWTCATFTCYWDDTTYSLCVPFRPINKK